MRRLVLVLAVMALALLVASGVALAITKQCKPNVRCVGTDASDTLTGTLGPDRIFGLRGMDYLIGRGDNDELYGGRASDYLIGRGDNDELYGGRASDSLDGGTGDDKLKGGQYGDYYDFAVGAWGEDTIIDIPEVEYVTRSTNFELRHQVTFYQLGADTPVRDLAIDLNSNSGPGPEVTDGVNTVNWDGNVITVVDNSNPGSDTIRGNDQTNHIDNSDSAGIDAIEGRAGADELFNINAGNVTDTVYGGPGNDLLDSVGSSLSGGTHPDKVFGGRGKDYIFVNDDVGGDTVDCGESPGDEDEVYYDEGDVISADCEIKVPQE